MTDRATVYELAQIGKETVHGVPVPAKLKCGAMSFEPTIDISVESFKPRGSKFATVAATNMDSTTFRVTGRPTYTELPYPLCSVIKDVTPTTPVGATNARLWTLRPETSDEDEPATYSVELGRKKRAMHASYLLFNDFGMTWNRRQGVSMDGAAIAQITRDNRVRWITSSGVVSGGTFALTFDDQTTADLDYDSTNADIKTALEALSNIDPGDVIVLGGPLPATPVYVRVAGQYETAILPAFTLDSTDITGGGLLRIDAITPSATTKKLVPILGKQVSVYTADSYAGLASAERHRRMFNATWRLSNRFGPIWALDDEQESWAAHIELDPTGQVTFRIGADDIGMQFLEKMRVNDRIFFRLIANGPLIEPGFRHFLQMTAAIDLTQVGQLGDEEGVVALDYTGTLAHDDTWGYSTEILLQNTLTAL